MSNFDISTTTFDIGKISDSCLIIFVVESILLCNEGGSCLFDFLLSNLGCLYLVFLVLLFLLYFALLSIFLCISVLNLVSEAYNTLLPLTAEHPTLTAPVSNPIITSCFFVSLSQFNLIVNGHRFTTSALLSLSHLLTAPYLSVGIKGSPSLFCTYTFCILFMKDFCYKPVPSNCYSPIDNVVSAS